MSVSTAFGVVFEQEPMLDATFITEFSAAVLATFTGKPYWYITSTPIVAGKLDMQRLLFSPI